jgi:hypothetical protein
MDINEHRDMVICFNGIQNADDIYTFYYDETNNIRKLYLTESGFNVDKADNFVLAGIMHKGLDCQNYFSELFNQLKLQKSVKELKLKHIAKGSFLDMLKSQGLHTILKWLLDNEFYIHYFNLNLLYWSIVDIIDSIIDESQNPVYVINHMLLKSDLYELANTKQDEFLEKLRYFNYPDVAKDQANAFCEWLVSFVDKNSMALPKDRAEFLNEFVRESLVVDDLPFISGFHSHELISNFMAFYLQKLYIFKNSKHIFDEEHNVEELLKIDPLVESGKPFKNYEFVKSHDFKAVQISDVIAGFLGKYFTYFKNVSFDQLMLDKQGLSAQQLHTLNALRGLIDVSDDLSGGLFNTVVSERESVKRNWFVHEVH